MEAKQPLIKSKYYFIILVIAYVGTKQLIRHYNNEAVSALDFVLDNLIYVLLLIASTFKVNDITKGSYSNLPEKLRIAIFVIGIGLVIFKCYLNFEHLILIKNQNQLINSLIFGLISFNYFNVVVTDKKRKQLTNFLKYFFGFMTLLNLLPIVF